MAPDPQHLLHHLTELRQRLVASGVAIVLGIIAGFVLAQPAMGWLLAASGIPGLKLVQLAPGEALMAAFKLAMLLGLAVASPVWLYQLIRFVSPGLTTTEKRALLAVTVGGMVLFAVGVGFAAMFVLPAALSFLLGFGAEVATNQIAISPFLDFCVALLVMNGLMFELPLVVWGLAAVGLLTSHAMLAKWREGVVAIAVLAAVLTPSQDPASMVLVAVTLLLLVGLSLIPLRLVGR